MATIDRDGKSLWSVADDVVSKLPIHKTPRELGINILSIALFIAVWGVISLFYADILIPGPLTVVDRMVEIYTQDRFFYHFKWTFFRVIAGFLTALIAATAIGIAMGTTETGQALFEVWILIGLSIPALAIGMIALMLLGLSELAAVAAIFATILPFITENMWVGTENLDRELIRMGRAFEVSTWSMITEIVLPQLVPYLLAATRYGLGLAWKIAVIVELLGMGNGIGFKITESFELFDTSGVVAWTLSFAIVMMFIEFGIIAPLENYLTDWQVDVEGGELSKR